MTEPAPCYRFEREGLLAVERGEPLDPHFDACPACREARAAYERLSAAIATAADDLEPPPDWQARIWAEVARRGASRRPWWRGWLVPAGAFAALAMVLAARWLTLAPAPAPELTVTVLPGDGVRRSAAAKPGDRLDLRAVTGAAHAELRVYRDDAEVVLRCAEEAPCRRRGRRLEASLVLPSIGSYQAVLLSSEAPVVPPTGGGLDADAAAALAEGVRVDLGDEVVVE